MRLDAGGDRRHAEQQGARGRADRSGKRSAVDLAVSWPDRARSACLDARHAQAALKLQLNKSDANDARGLIVRTGWYREVAVKGLDGQLVRALITARAQLVALRVDLGNQIRGILKPFGLLAGKGVGKTFAEKVRSLVPDSPLHDVVEALLRSWEAINKEVATLSRRLVTGKRCQRQALRGGSLRARLNGPARVDA